MSKLMTDFKNFPIVIQVIIVLFSWIVLFFVTDAWFAPFFIKGYMLLTYTFVVLLVSSKLAHSSIDRLIKSEFVWDWTGTSVTESHSVKKHRAGRKLSMKDVTERELNILVRKFTSTIISQWVADESSDNDDFVKEIHNQVEDIIQALSHKLSKVKVEKFVRSTVQLIHHHLKKYIQTVGSQNKFPFSHPVSKGEISIECYLDSLSHTIMKEFIPGSVQDCSAVFDLLSTAFCRQVLVQFVKNLSEPELVLLSVLQLLESTRRADSCDDDDVPDFALILKDLPAIVESIDEPLLGSSPRSREAEELECNDQCNYPDMVDGISNNDLIATSTNSPVLAGNGITCATVKPNPTEQSSCIQTGLSCSLSAATAALLQSQPGEKFKPPDSLPLESGGSIDSAPASAGEADISPVYEDVEDFATAIAKLRSLLEQRVAANGGSNGTDGSANSSVKSTGDTFSPNETRTGSSGGETESSFEELAEASELPADNRLFVNIKIPRTEVCTLPLEGQHSIYCITYDGIYTAVSSRTAVTTTVSEGANQQKDSRLVLKSRLIRRRFREFMQLHGQLETNENTAIAQAMRSIRGPSKWLNLPFSRLDQNTVAHRQIFLERYMQQLCRSNVIGTSTELRQFLDYELPLNDAIQTSFSINRVPFFAKTVSDVLQSIKTALPLPIPGFDNGNSQVPAVELLPLPPILQSSIPESPGLTDRDVFLTKSNGSTEEVDGRSSPVRHPRIAYSCEEGRLEQLLLNWNQNGVESAYEAFESNLWRSELNAQVQETTTTLASPPRVPKAEFYYKPPIKIKAEDWNRFDEELPLSSSIINLMIECLSSRETWLTKAPVALAVKILVGQRIETQVQEMLYQLSNPDRLTEHLRRLRSKLVVSPKKGSPMAIDPAKQQDVSELIAKVVSLLENQLPGWLIRFLGEDLCSDVLTTVVSCFGDLQLNRDLALTLLDFVFTQISSLGISKTPCANPN